MGAISSVLCQQLQYFGCYGGLSCQVFKGKLKTESYYSSIADAVKILPQKYFPKVLYQTVGFCSYSLFGLVAIATENMKMPKWQSLNQIISSHKAVKEETSQKCLLVKLGPQQAG